MSRTGICTILAASFAVAVADGESKTPKAALAFASEHEYWKQFNSGHVSVVPVESYLEQLASPLIWSGSIQGSNHSIWWDQESGSFSVFQDDVGVEDVITVYDIALRPSFAYGFVNGVAAITGFVDVDEENKTLVIQIAHGSSVNRAITVSQPADSKTPPQAQTLLANCTCFGLGNQTSVCSDTNCDNGTKCGKNRACRWAAAQQPPGE